MFRFKNLSETGEENNHSGRVTKMLGAWKCVHMCGRKQAKILVRESRLHRIRAGVCPCTYVCLSRWWHVSKVAGYVQKNLHLSAYFPISSCARTQWNGLTIFFILSSLFFPKLTGVVSVRSTFLLWKFRAILWKTTYIGSLFSVHLYQYTISHNMIVGNGTRSMSPCSNFFFAQTRYLVVYLHNTHLLDRLLSGIRRYISNVHSILM